MVRVKEDYFKGGESFFKSPELNELLEDMDANGVEKAILMTKASATSEDRAVRFAEAAPDRFALAVGGFNLLRTIDRKSVVWGKSVSVRVDLGGRRIIKKQNRQQTLKH